MQLQRTKKRPKNSCSGQKISAKTVAQRTKETSTKHLQWTKNFSKNSCPADKRKVNKTVAADKKKSTKQFQQTKIVCKTVAGKKIYKTVVS